MDNANCILNDFQVIRGYRVPGEKSNTEKGKGNKDIKRAKNVDYNIIRLT